MNGRWVEVMVRRIDGANNIRGSDRARNRLGSAARPSAYVLILLCDN